MVNIVLCTPVVILQILQNPEVPRIHLDKVLDNIGAAIPLGVQGVHDLIELVGAAQEQLILIGLLSAQVVGHQLIDGMLILPEVSWVHLPLPDEVGGNK